MKFRSGRPMQTIYCLLIAAFSLNIEDMLPTLYAGDAMKALLNFCALITRQPAAVLQRSGAAA